MTKLDSKVSLSRENFHFPRLDSCLAKVWQSERGRRPRVDSRRKGKFSQNKEKAKSFDCRRSNRSNAAQIHLICCFSIMILLQEGQRSKWPQWLNNSAQLTQFWGSTQALQCTRAQHSMFCGFDSLCRQNWDLAVLEPFSLHVCTVPNLKNPYFF